jgi:hypothetical protein
MRDRYTVGPIDPGIGRLQPIPPIEPKEPRPSNAAPVPEREGRAETANRAADQAGLDPVQANRDQSSGDSTTTFRPLGALLGWIFPGLGHIAAGNTKRGLLAMAGVLFLFLTGIAVGGIDSVDRTEDKLWFYAQAGCGPIAFATSFANDALLKSGDAAPMIEMPSPPGAPKVMASSFKGLAHANEFGTLFVFFAGLLNICVLLDAAVRAPASDGVTAGRRLGEGASR